MTSRDVRAGLESILADARSLTSALDDDQINRRPPHGGWSVAQCLDHLTITARRMMKAMDAAVDELRPRGARLREPWKPSLLGLGFLWLLEPPVRRGKFKAPVEFHGQPGRPAHLVRSEFTTAHEELLHRLPDYEAWDQNIRVVVSSFDPRGKLKYSIGLALRIIPAHARRHLWQARKVLEERP